MVEYGLFVFVTQTNKHYFVLQALVTGLLVSNCTAEKKIILSV